MTGLSLITAPAIEPLTLQEAKSHLRVTASDDDSLILALITAVRQSLEGRFGELQRALITQTWDWYYDVDSPIPPAALIIPLPPLQSVTSIKYIDVDGVLQTWDAAKYTVDATSLRGRVTPAWGESWPEARCTINAIIVRFVAGFGATAADVPAPIRHAMLLQIAHLYDNRDTHMIGGSVEQLPAVRNLLAPYWIATF